MILALCSGALFREPERRTAKSGKPFVTATIKARDGDGFQFVKIIAFAGAAQAELLRLADGDSLSVQGPFKAETYQASDGSTKISLSIIAGAVLPLRPPPKPKKAPAEKKPAASSDRRAPAPFDDGLPEWGP